MPAPRLGLISFPHSPFPIPFPKLPKAFGEADCWLPISLADIDIDIDGRPSRHTASLLIIASAGVRVCGVAGGHQSYARLVTPSPIQPDSQADVRSLARFLQIEICAQETARPAVQLREDDPSRLSHVRAAGMDYDSK